MHEGKSRCMRSISERIFHMQAQWARHENSYQRTTGVLSHTSKSADLNFFRKLVAMNNIIKTGQSFCN